MLTLSDISKAYGGRVLFAEAALQVNRGDRIGLVGPNGAGKSTLFPSSSAINRPIPARPPANAASRSAISRRKPPWSVTKR